VVFASVAQSDSGWYELQGVTPIEPGWLSEIAPHVYTNKQ
jgi:ATP-dependent RNA helicase DDX35